MRRFFIPLVILLVPILGGASLWYEVQVVRISLSSDIDVPAFIQIRDSDIKPENINALVLANSANRARYQGVLENVKAERAFVDRVLIGLGLLITVLTLLLLFVLYKPPSEVWLSEPALAAGQKFGWKQASVIAWGLIWRTTAIGAAPSLLFYIAEQSLKISNSSFAFLVFVIDTVFYLLAMVVAVKWLFGSTRPMSS